MMFRALKTGSYSQAEWKDLIALAAICFILKTISVFRASGK
jgi:hypothetical protein